MSHEPAGNSKIGMAFLLSTALFLGLGAYAELTGPPESVAIDSDLEAGGGGTEFNRTAVEAAAVAAINDARESEGRSRLAKSDELGNRARSWSEQMARTGSLTHDSPQCSPGGENVAQTFWRTAVETDQGTERYTTEAELGNAIAQQWLTSETHRENVMRPAFSKTGIGVAQRGEAVYATQRLCG